MKMQFLQDRVLQQVGPATFGLACEAANLIYNSNGESTYFIIATALYDGFITVTIIDEDGYTFTTKKVKDLIENMIIDDIYRYHRYDYSFIGLTILGWEIDGIELKYTAEKQYTKEIFLVDDSIYLYA